MNQESTTKIAQLEAFLKKFPPDHPMRPIIETDLRKQKDQQQGRTYERDTFDIRNHNFHSK